MYFCGKTSKYDEGQQVFCKVPDSTLYSPCTIENIGILGSKLSENAFLYEVTCDNGKTYKVTEDALSTDAGGNRPEATLHLTLTFNWFDAIKSGFKTEEYREIKKHWFRRFCYFNHYEGDDLDLLMTYLREPFSEYPIDLNYINHGRGHSTRFDSNGIPLQDISSVFDFSLALCKYQKVVFHRGYTDETMEFEIKSISIGKGKPKFGAPELTNVFIIKLGKRYE